MADFDSWQHSSQGYQPPGRATRSCRPVPVAFGVLRVSEADEPTDAGMQVLRTYTEEPGGRAIRVPATG